jgi:plasmid stabilization system protein ParE
VTTHEFRPQAQQELLDAAQWYLADGGPAVAEQFEWATQRALRLLAFMPQLGSPSYPGVRTWPLKQFPYTLVYRVKGAVISVIAVAHQSREPGYWVGR